VKEALDAGDLPEARQRTAMIVGRDTEHLEESELTRATVESVAESTVDGVTAPLLFAAVAGPVGAVVYRIVNTMDSMFGYNNERYREFGWAPARLDDLANLIPARVTGLTMMVAAVLTGLRGGGAWRIMRRDARRHPSPNSGYTEAAMAGALGVQLGGPSTYAGKPSAKPTIGDPDLPLQKNHIAQANRLLLATCLLFLAVAAGVSGWLHCL